MPGHRETGVSGTGVYNIGSYVRVKDMDFILVTAGPAHIFPNTGPRQRIQHAGIFGVAWSPAGDWTDPDSAISWWSFAEWTVQDKWLPAEVVDVNHFFWVLEPGVVADVGASWV